MQSWSMCLVQHTQICHSTPHRLDLPALHLAFHHAAAFAYTRPHTTPDPSFSALHCTCLTVSTVPEEASPDSGDCVLPAAFTVFPVAPRRPPHSICMVTSSVVRFPYPPFRAASFPFSERGSLGSCGMVTFSLVSGFTSAQPSIVTLDDLCPVLSTSTATVPAVVPTCTPYAPWPLRARNCSHPSDVSSEPAPCTHFHPPPPALLAVARVVQCS